MNDERDWLARRFEENRPSLQKVAERMLGSSSDAEDVVQEAWLRLSRIDAHEVENLNGWLTTVVARVCLDVLRSRRLRNARELPAPASSTHAHAEHDILLADSVGAALVVVLDSLSPAERVAFVLHDVFDVPFDEIAPIVGRSLVAAKQLASRARRRVQCGAHAYEQQLAHDDEVVRAFLVASREGKFDALVAMLAPDAVLRADAAAIETAKTHRWASLSSEAHGARTIAETLSGRAQGVRPVRIDDAPGAAWTHNGETRIAWIFTIDDGKIVEIELLLDPSRLAQLHVVNW